jgi:hypothetical protein
MGWKSDMTQFYLGQEVEVRTTSYDLEIAYPAAGSRWRKAKIAPPVPTITQRYRVQFPDGTHGSFSAEHIRAATLHERIRLKLTEVGRGYCDWSYRK